MATEQPLASDEAGRARRVRRNAIVLGLVALAFYLSFIVLTVARGS